MIWEHEGQTDRIRLSGPFSQGLVSIVVQNEHILIRESDGTLHDSADSDGLLREMLGFTVPFGSFRHWLLGTPAPSAEFRTEALDRAETSRAFSQQGWSVRYQRFVAVDGFQLPQKMAIADENVQVKLVVDEWVVH